MESELKRAVDRPYIMVFKSGRKIISKSPVINTAYFRRMMKRYSGNGQEEIARQAYKRYKEMGGKLPYEKIIKKGE